MENELKYQGLMLDVNTVSELDFILSADGNKIKIPENTNTERHFYNQGALKRTRNACALYGSAGAISDLTGYKFSEEELLEIVDLAEAKYGWQEDIGMYMSKAVDCLRNWWNVKFPEDKLTTFRAQIADEVFKEGLEKGHSFVVGYRTSKEYYNDSQDDGVIDGEDFPTGGGHLVRTNFNNFIKIDDNYFGKKKYNTYTNNKIKTLVDNGVFFPSAYIFLKDTTLEDEIRDNIDLERAKNQFDKGNWNGLNPRGFMSRQEVMTVIDRIEEKYEKTLFDTIEKYKS